MIEWETKEPQPRDAIRTASVYLPGAYAFWEVKPGRKSVSVTVSVLAEESMQVAERDWPEESIAELRRVLDKLRNEL